MESSASAGRVASAGLDPRRWRALALRLPKYVVSATLANPAWNGSTVLNGDVLNEVSTLKQTTAMRASVRGVEGSGTPAGW